VIEIHVGQPGDRVVAPLAHLVDLVAIEDAAGGAEPYDPSLAIARIVAAVETSRALKFPLVLTARAENYLRGKQNLDDTIKRLQAFEAAGADVLFAPGLPDLATVRLVCAAVKKPVNVIGSMQNGELRLADLAGAGVKRISLATALYRAAMTALRDAAQEAKEGAFSFSSRAMTTPDLNSFLRG